MGRYPLIPDLVGRPVTVGQYLALQEPLLAQLIDSDDPWADRICHGLGVARGTGLEPDAVSRFLAVDHGYTDVADVAAHGADPVDPSFEAAADAIQWGDLDGLRRLLDRRPGLVHQRSPFPHHATLLHHVSANGIEVERQLQSPANAVDVARLLLERGADPDASCDIYGGGPAQTALCHLVSSCVPAEAGVQGALVEALCAGGAAVDGVEDDSAPLWTAVTFGYREAAEALVRCGARVDNLALAAAMGDLDRVRALAAGALSGSDGAGAALRIGARGPEIPAGQQLDYALIWAALHDRRQVVEWLLGQGPDLTVRDPFFDSTALGAARYAGNTELVTLLEAAIAGSAPSP